MDQQKKSSGADPATQGKKNGGTDEHLTPQPIIDALLRLWPEGIDLDPCSNQLEPNIPAADIFTVIEDGLNEIWLARTVFVNPPYSENKKWSDKFLAELVAGHFNEAVVLNKNDNRVVSWFGAYQDNCDAFCIYRGYLRFGDAKSGAKFPSVLWYFGPHPRRFIRVFSSLGWCYATENVDLKRMAAPGK